MAPADIPDVYSHTLSHCGNGHALWIPEGADNSDEIQIGDVGFIDKSGTFNFLFSIDKKYKDDAGRRMENYITETPCQYFEFSARKTYHNFAPKHTEYLSRSVKKTDVAGTVRGGLAKIVNASVDLSYSMEEDQGAACILPEGAVADREDVNRRFEDYIKSNIDNWYEHVSKEKSIALEQLIVIRGTTKAMQYLIVALYGSSKSGAVNIGTSAFDVIDAGITARFHVKTDCCRQSRSLLGTRDHHAIAADKRVAMFINYYRMKRRYLWPLNKLEAKAGPDVLPPAEDPSSDVMVVVDEDNHETSLAVPMGDQPVDLLLDFILETCPDAERALACDEEVYSLYQGEKLPNDILASLRERQPRIFVDRHKVGTVALEDTIRRERIFEIMGNLKSLDTTGEEDHSSETAGIPLRGATVVLHGSPGGEEKFNWPHQYLSGKGSLKSTTISSDSKLIAAGYDDTTIILWDLITGTVVSHLNRHEDSVYALAFSPNGTELASGSGDATVIIWTVVANERRMTIAENDPSILEGHELDVIKVVYSPDGSVLITGSLDGIIKVWDASNGYELIRNIDNTIWPHALVFTPDSKKLITAAKDLIYVWDPTVSADTSALIATMSGHAGDVYMIAVSHDGTRVASASEDQTARVWNVENGEELLTLHEHTGAVWCIAFSPDDSNVVTGSDDKSIVVADSWTGERRHIFTDHPRFVNTIGYSKNGDLICAGTMEGTIQLLDARTGQFVAEYHGHTGKVNTMKFSTDDDSIISSSEDGTIRTFSVSDVLRLRF